MTAEQDEVSAFLGNAASYGMEGAVEIMDTHISRIFLVGDRVFKLKRAVRLPYVDFSTPERRIASCLREVELNGSSAPGLYLGIRRIVRTPAGTLAFDAVGRPVDAVVEMVRFDQAALADRMATDGRLAPGLMEAMARMVAALHAAAPVIHEGGGATNIRAVLDINDAGFATSHVFDAEEVGSLGRRFRDALAQHSERLDRRESMGKVRRCHGDLHLRNICVLEGVPYPFDCIEFNDGIATVDILYDLAFLLMDLWHRGFREYANLVANRYFDQSDEEDGFVLLPFFMAIRAAVRAHVTATQTEAGDGNATALNAQARSYFSLADALLDTRPPRLIAIGGLSGSGKSTVAEALAPVLGMPPGARIVESDRIRKAIYGVSVETRLNADAYRAEVSARVYGEIARRAGAIVAAGGSVVADAVFDRVDHRRTVEDAARGRARFDGFWLSAPPEVLRRRVTERKKGPSDADLAVLEMQLGKSSEAIEWRQLQADRPLTELVRDALG